VNEEVEEKVVVLSETWYGCHLCLETWTSILQ